MVNRGAAAPGSTEVFPRDVHAYYPRLGRALCGSGVFAAAIVVFGCAANSTQRRPARV
jgi:hypothetical protein